MDEQVAKSKWMSILSDLFARRPNGAISHGDGCYGARCKLFEFLHPAPGLIHFCTKEHNPFFIFCCINSVQFNFFAQGCLNSNTMRWAAINLMRVKIRFLKIGFNLDKNKSILILWGYFLLQLHCFMHWVVRLFGCQIFFVLNRLQTLRS